MGDYLLDSLNSDYWALHYRYRAQINKICNAKQKVQMQQELDKMDHYIRKINGIADDLDCYFSAFGADDDAAKNS